MFQTWSCFHVTEDFFNKQFRMFAVCWRLCTHRLCRCVWHEHDGPENKRVVTTDSPGLFTFCCSTVRTSARILYSVDFGDKCKKKLLTSITFCTSSSLIPSPYTPCSPGHAYFIFKSMNLAVFTVIFQQSWNVTYLGLSAIGLTSLDC